MDITSYHYGGGLKFIEDKAPGVLCSAWLPGIPLFWEEGEESGQLFSGKGGGQLWISRLLRSSEAHLSVRLFCERMDLAGTASH